MERNQLEVLARIVLPSEGHTGHTPPQVDRPAHGQEFQPSNRP